MLKNFLTVICCAMACTLQAQLSQTARFEKERKFNDNNFIVVSASDRGILLFRESSDNKAKKNSNLWDVIKLNTGLEEDWTLALQVEYKYDIIGYEYFDGHLYLLFKEQYSGDKAEFYLIKIDDRDGSDNRYEIKSELEMIPTHLLINDEQMVLGGEISYRSTLVVFNYLENRELIVPGFFNKKSFILDFNYNKEHQLYNILMAEKNAGNRNELTLRTFNKEGKVVIDEKYEFEEDLRALNGKVMIGSDNRIYYAGSYGYNNSYYSLGLYFGYLKARSKMKMKFHNLIDLDHVFDYMSEKRVKRLHAKIQEGIRNKKPFEYKTQLTLQSMNESNGQFAILSDIYRPEYQQNITSDNRQDVYDNNTNQRYVTYASGINNVQGASGVEYYQGVLILVNPEGKLIWDNSLPTPRVETLALERLSAAYVSDANSCLIYKNENDLKYKIFNNSLDVVNDTTESITTFDDNDEIVRMTDSQGRVEDWYDNHLFVWGYQRIENNAAANKDKRRHVFFINKITIE